MEAPYFVDSRVRQKLVPWKIPGVPARLERGVLRNMVLIRDNCPPRVLAAYFRAVWGGWVTDRRMGSLLRTKGLKERPCMLRCGWDEDNLYHYGRCRVFWEFLAESLEIPLADRSAESFLLLGRHDASQKIKLAKGIYALHRAVQHLRHHPESGADPTALLKAYLLRA